MAANDQKNYRRMYEESQYRCACIDSELSEFREETKRQRIAISSKDQAIEEQKNVICELEKLIGELRENITWLTERLKDSEQKNKSLCDKIKAKEERIAKLESILNNNSQNTSLPPSTDQKPVKKRANEYNSRCKTGRKPGGQKGHRGNTLTKKDVERILKNPECRYIIKNVGETKGRYITRYEVSATFQPMVTEYGIYPDDKGKYNIPDYLTCPVSYGNELKTIVTGLYGVGFMSVPEISEFIDNMTDHSIRLSTGTVENFCQGFADLSKKSLLNIENQIRVRDVIYTDSTNVRVNGKQYYVRNVSTENEVIYYGLPSKSKDELNKIKLISEYGGVIGHDHEMAMYGNVCASHAECNVHLLRYLRKNSEDTNNGWSGRLATLMTGMNSHRKSLIENGKTTFTDTEIADYEEKYEEILKTGKEQNSKTSPAWAAKEENALLNRLLKFKDNYLFFLRRFDVAFDNNLSERDLRKHKCKQKMSGGFRSENGCKIFCDVLSVIETAKRRNMSPYTAISNIFNGKNLFQSEA